MSSLNDIYTQLSAAVQAVTNISQLTPRIGGTVTAISCLSSTPIQVLPADTKRNNLSFHNPMPPGGVGGPIVYIAPVTIGSSQGVLLPSLTALAGCISVMPNEKVSLAGNVQQAYQAFVSSGSSQPLTIFTQ